MPFLKTNWEQPNCWHADASLNLHLPKQIRCRKRESNDMQNENNLAEALSSSKIYQDYERAFSEATGLPVALRPVESWQLPLHGRRSENPFCAMMAAKSRACAACLQVEQKLSEKAGYEPGSETCQIGMYDTAVPVRL